MKEREDYNHLKQWLGPKLESKGLSMEKFATSIGVSRASIYFWLKDITRPSEQSMAKVCIALGESLADGLAQFTPKPNGRPPGKRGASEMSVKRRR